MPKGSLAQDYPKKEPDRYCNGRKRTGGYCTQRAGWGTDHPGTGRCKLHGGSSTGPPPKHGRYMKVRRQLKEKYQHFLKDPNPIDLSDEIALLRGLVHQHLDENEDLDSNEIAINQLINLLSELTKVSERQSRIMQRQAVTMKELFALSKGLEILVVDLAKEYVPVDKQRAFTEHFAKGLRDIIGGAAGAARSGTIQPDGGGPERPVDQISIQAG